MASNVEVIPQNTKEQIPSAARAGGLVYSSTITGVDPKTGRLGDGPEQQFELAFGNLRSLVDQAKLTPDNVGLVTVFIRDQSLRSYINKPWLDLFPTDGNRPARKTTQHGMPEGQLVQLQMVAVEQGKRQSVEVPGLAHRDPLPNATRIGNMVFSSVIVPQDPATSQNVEGAQKQIDVAFENMKIMIEKAGGSLQDIVHVWVFLKDFTYQPYMVDVWVKTFPEDGSRPARKTVRYDLQGNSEVQLQMTAVLNGKRENFEVEGVAHHDPIPLGAKIGNIFYSSGVGGVDRKTGKTPHGAEEQTDLALDNMRALMENAGGTLSSISEMTVLIKDFADQPAILRAWQKYFPAGGSRPAVHIMPLGISGEAHMQLHSIAAL